MSRVQREQLDAELRARGGLRAETIDDARAGFAESMATMVVSPDVAVSDTTLGGLRALLVEPVDDGPVERRPGRILYLHGGANIVGSPETAIGLTSHLVARSGVPAISVDYRLAPEHPFPANVEDAASAYRALLDSGVGAEAIILAGDSAGGGLAVSGTLAARQAGLPLPAGLVLFSPGLDQTRSGASLRTNLTRDAIFPDPDAFNGFSALYLAGADPAQPLLSPAVHADLDGFPPVLVQVGSGERLLDDSLRFAQRAREADVDVILDVVAAVPHVFPMWAGRLDEADEALERAALFVRQRLGGSVLAAS